MTHETFGVAALMAFIAHHCVLGLTLETRFEGLTLLTHQKGAGGLLAYIRNDLLVYRCLKLESSDIESICLDVKDSNNSRFIVCACYRSPTKCKESHCLASPSTAAENMYNTRKELLLLGDFHMDMYENRDESRFPDKAG